MKRKCISYLFLLMTGVGVISCNDWLSIKSDQDIFEETLFEKADGYYSALNGMYQSLSESQMYGREMSWGVIEAWGRGYDLLLPEHQDYHDVACFEYKKEGAKKIADELWLNCFNVIAEANNLLQNLETDKTTVFPLGETVRDMIQGEAYAIRAMMHFELVRIFAKAPVVDDGGISAMIPFVDKFPSKVNTPIPTKDVLARVIADLEKAKTLIQPFDTSKEYPGYKSFEKDQVSLRVKIKAGTNYGDDAFFLYRGNRLNYYAVLQLLGRVCLYAGEQEKAFLYANKVVEMVLGKRIYNFVNPFYIGNPMVLEIVEPRLHSEILFGTYNTKERDWTLKSFDATENMRFLLTVKGKIAIFEKNTDDCRLKAIPDATCTKFSLKGKNQELMDEANSLVPVLRFPESFYIVAESRFDKDKAKAIDVFNKMVEGRNNEVYKLDINISKDEFMKALVKEYRREFLSEGVMVYVYKRLNIPFEENGTLVPHNGKLVMPIPDSEASIH